MRKRKPIISRNCAFCGAKFKTRNERKIYEHPRCAVNAFNKRQLEKIRKAQEILQREAGL